MLVPAGGLDMDGVWRGARTILVPVEAPSQGFRGMLNAGTGGIIQNGLSEVWDKKMNYTLTAPYPATKDS